MKVRIKKTSKKAYGGQQSDGALDVTPAAWGGADMKSAKEGAEVQQSLTSVPRSKANLEAEGGETAFGPISGDTIPDHYKIKGPRHTNGGVPLNLPDDTFIFSDTKAMKITDPKILTMFGKKAKKGGYTPADLAKPFDINKYKGILMNPDTDRKERETAELMIKNYIMKLGALALAQESKKGFPQGIPEMARPYMEANGITEDQLLPQQEQEGGAAEEPMMRIGGNLNTYEGDKDGSAVNENKKTLNDVESYKNATDQQKALYESLTPEQRKMMVSTARQQPRGQFDNQPRVSGFPGGYNQQQGYPNQRGGRRGFSDFNPFGQRAFTKDFDYLTPFNSPTFSGTNTPFTGQMPAGTNNLTSISQSYKKNPFFKSLFNKDMARKEFTTRYNFNGTGSSTPSLAGGNNAISNFKTPQLDFNQSTQSGAGSQGLAGNVSNRQFAKDFQGEGFGSRRDIRRALRKGDMTQQEYMDLMDREGSPTTTTGSGPIPKPDNSAIPSWITDPIGSIQSGTGSSPAPAGTSNQNAIPSWITDPVGSATSGNESMITDQIRNSVMNSGKVIKNNNPANPTSSMRNAFATGSLQGIKDQLASFDKNQAINRSTTATGNESAINLGGRLNQMRTDAGMYDTTPTNTTFDFSTDRTQPTYTFGQAPIVKPLDTQGTDVYRRSLLKDGVDDGRNNNPNSGNLFGFNEGGIIGYDEDGNPIYAPGTEPEIVDTWFDKAYYGDRSIGQRKAGEKGFETSAGGVDFSSVDKVNKPKTALTYEGALKNFPLSVFNFDEGLENVPFEVESEDDESSEGKFGEKERVIWGPAQDRINEQDYVNRYKQKNFYPRKQEVLDWYNKSIKQIPSDSKAALDLQVWRDTTLDKLETQFNDKFGFQDYEVNVSSRPSGELTSPYVGESFAKGPGYGGPGQGFKRAFGGENPILDMFVYGGDNKYPHGGSFHMPEKDFTTLSTPELGKLPGTFTANEPYVNQLTGASPSVVYNSETGGYDETNPEYAEGNNPFSIETTQKVNSAFTFRPDVFMGQLGAGARAVGNAADAVNQGLNTVDAQDLARMENSSERVRRGGDYANEQGVMARNAISPTSNMNYMTKFGGTPMAMYGAEMGGAYYPTMREGGTRKVRILPTASHGKTHKNPDGTPKTAEQLQAELDAGANVKVVSKKELPDGTIEIKKSDGTVVYAKGSQGSTKVVESDLGKAKGSGTAPGAGWADTICNQLKKGVSIDQLVTDGHGTKKGLEAQFADCITETKTDNSEFYEVEAEETVDKKTGKKKCKCFKLDEQGNQTEEVISETIVNADEECPVCEATVEAMRGADPKDPGGYSDMELEGIRSAQKMRYKMPRVQSRYAQNEEAIPTLVSPRVADIKSKGAQNVRAMQAAGLKPNQIVAALMGPGMEQSLAEQGRRYNIADTTNSKILTDSEIRNKQSKAATDRANAMLFSKDSVTNANFAAKENQLRNVRGATILSAKQLADKGRRDRASLNFELEDFQIDRNYNPYKRYNPKDPNPTKPGKSRMQTYADYLKEFGKDDPNIGRLADADYKEQAGIKGKYGGFIPRYTTMPYGN